MARQAKIKNETILEAAREVFLEKGGAATTSEVASKAGVSEGTIFKRFGSKDNLFRTAMQPHYEDLNWLDHLPHLIGVGNIEENLLKIALEGITAFRRLVPLMMMSWSNPQLVSSFSSPLMTPDSPPLIAMRRLTAFFRAEIDLKRLKSNNPEIIARIFLGSIAQYAFFEALMTSTTQSHLIIPVEDYAKELVEVLLHGVKQ